MFQQQDPTSRKNYVSSYSGAWLLLLKYITFLFLGAPGWGQWVPQNKGARPHPESFPPGILFYLGLASSK